MLRDDYLQDPPLLLFFASGFITRLKAQQAPITEQESITHEGVYYIPKDLLEFSNLYRQKSREYVWE